MPLYSFICKVCQKEKDFLVSMTDVCESGKSMQINDGHDGFIECPSCKNLNWQRVWNRKPPSARTTFRWTSI